MTPYKLKIMNTQPTISDEEIQSHMNFDGLLISQKKALAKRRTKIKTIRIMSAVIGIATVSGLLYINFPKQKAQTDPTSIHPPDPDSPKQPSEENRPGKGPSLSPDKPKSIAKKKLSIAQKTIPSTVPKTENAAKNSALDSTYQEAEPVDGFPALYEYFNKELKYPDAAVKDSIQGVLTISFIITKDGKPDQLKTINSLGAAFDQEAFRLIEKMPSWKPARMNGNPVASKISLPLTFHLKKVKP